MTAINVVCQKQHDLVQILTDAAVYRPDGIVEAMSSDKVFPVAHWPGVVGVRGAAIAVPLLGSTLAMRFESFDALINGVETALPGIVEECGLMTRHAELILAGIGSQGPAAYVIETSDQLPRGISAEEAAQHDYLQAYKLTRLPDVINGPAVTDQAMIIAADYDGIDPDASPETVAWSMRKLLEMQRRFTVDDGIHWIGGYGVMTTVSPRGIEQGIVCRWSQDRAGERLRPAPIDWAQWHRDNPKPITGPAAAPVEMMARGMVGITNMTFSEAMRVTLLFLNNLAGNSSPQPPVKPDGVVPFQNRAERRRAAREGRGAG